MDLDLHRLELGIYIVAPRAEGLAELSALAIAGEAAGDAPLARLGGDPVDLCEPLTLSSLRSTSQDHSARVRFSVVCLRGGGSGRCVAPRLACGRWSCGGGRRHDVHRRHPDAVNRCGRPALTAGSPQPGREI
jgi:hypothetical protein